MEKSKLGLLALGLLVSFYVKPGVRLNLHARPLPLVAFKFAVFLMSPDTRDIQRENRSSGTYNFGAPASGDPTSWCPLEIQIIRQIFLLR